MNSQSQLAVELREKDYRDAFVAAQLRVGLPMQCRALRESREWTQPQLAEAAGMSQPRISEIERPGERKLNIETLLRLASAFDVALQVKFVPFSKFVDEDDALDLASFCIPPFEEDLAHVEAIEERMKSVAVLTPKGRSTGLIEALLGGQQSAHSNALKVAERTPAQIEGQVQETQIERQASEYFSRIAS